MLHQEGKQARNQAPAHKQHPVADIETQKATATQEILEHPGHSKVDATRPCAPKVVANVQRGEKFQQ